MQILHVVYLIGILLVPSTRVAADPWLVLGLDPHATAAEVRLRHRQLARQFHPAANLGDRHALARMSAINVARDEALGPRPVPTSFSPIDPREMIARSVLLGVLPWVPARLDRDVAAFATDRQLEALRLLAGALGHRVTDFVPRALEFTSDRQIEALRVAVQMAGGRVIFMLDDILNAICSQGLETQR